MARLVLIALFLISAAPRKADYQRCIMVKGPSLLDGESPMEGNAPVSDLASWRR